MKDLVYFGEDYDLRTSFLQKLLEKFPKVKFEDAYDTIEEIKGYCKYVILDDSCKENYFVWMIGRNWIDVSFQLSSIEYTNEIELAKIQYPEAFKPFFS